MLNLSHSKPCPIAAKGLVKVNGMVMTKEEAAALAKGKAAKPQAAAGKAAPARVEATQATMQVAAAVKAERARVAAVFASKASVGRERLAAEFLGTDRSAADITAALAVLPTDAAREQAAKVAQHKQAGSTWGRVIASMNERNGFAA